MNVLCVSQYLDTNIGAGTAERTFQMSRYLARKNVVCNVITTDLGLRKKRIDELESVNVLILGCITKRFAIPLFRREKILRLIKEADVIHIISHWTLINAGLYFWVKKLNKPYVFCPAGSLSYLGRSKFLKKIYNIIIGKKIIENASYCIAITESEKNDISKYNFPKNRIWVIPNGINQNELPRKNEVFFRKKYNLESKPYILFVGRLNYIKGPDILLEAFYKAQRHLASYDLIYIGADGGLLQTLKFKCRQYGIEKRVHFLGYFDRWEKYQAIYGAHLVVIPSRNEAMSIVVLEAGITGTPVLLTDNCGFDQVQKVEGGIVSNANENDIAKNMVYLLNDNEKLEKYGENLKNYILRTFTWDKVISKYIKLFDKIVCSS